MSDAPSVLNICMFHGLFWNCCENGKTKKMCLQLPIMIKKVMNICKYHYSSFWSFKLLYKAKRQLPPPFGFAHRDIYAIECPKLYCSPHRVNYQQHDCAITINVWMYYLQAMLALEFKIIFYFWINSVWFVSLFPICLDSIIIWMFYA